MEKEPMAKEKKSGILENKTYSFLYIYLNGGIAWD
jgi:hypothetical protein